MLVCGAEPSALKRLAARMAGSGFLARESLTQDATRDAARFRPAAIILDLRGCEREGLDAGRALREDPRTRATPLLFLVAAEEPGLVLRCFASGADDCVPAGTDPRVLAAHLEALVRRYARARSATRRKPLVSGPLRLDYETWSVAVRGKRVRLTPKEFGLLELLMLREGCVVARAAMLERMRRSFELTCSHALEVHISNLRAKLGPRCGRLIEAVPGVGYLLRQR